MICLLIAYVIGCNRVPEPPARIIPFIITRITRIRSNYTNENFTGYFLLILVANCFPAVAFFAKAKKAKEGFQGAAKYEQFLKMRIGANEETRIYRELRVRISANEIT